jgi:hypothetical protein
MTQNVTPTLGNIRTYGSMADRRVYVVPVTYPGEVTREVAFTGPTTEYGPVVMVTERFPNGLRVYDAGRYGEFGPNWIREFFS